MRNSIVTKELRQGSSEILATLVGKLCYRSLELIPEDPAIKKLLGAARARDFLGMISSAESLETQSYSSALDRGVKTQLSAVVKKYPFTSDEAPGFDPEGTAWKKFLAAEHRCKRVNQRSALLRYGVGFPYGEFISIMKGYIRRVIGRSPDYAKIYDHCDWGPGANVGVSGDRTNFARKFLARPWTVTPLALSYCTRALWSNDQLRILTLMGEGPFVSYDWEKFQSLVRQRVRLVTSNNICFVPKTFKTNRSIASEPLLNGYLQKGVDLYLRERLAHVGIDLRDQEQNQLMARKGSLGGFNPYATLDLSSASDSLSIGICKTLLPPDWFEFLNSIRSHQYKYRGQVLTYHKFVSMGNGFCFPLQTLVFAAVCYASSVINQQPVDFRVYGDDIIVRQSLALQVIEVLKYLGFVTNSDKTHVVGPFRESCGADWHCGQDVRPVYVDFRIDTNIDLYKIHNSFLRSEACMGISSHVRDWLREICPPELRLVRPYHGNADAAFTVAKDVAMSSKFVVWDRRTWAWAWKEVSFTPIRDKLVCLDPTLCNELEYLAVLRGSSSRAPLTVRRKTRARLRRKSYWGVDGDKPYTPATESRGETP